MKPEAGGYSVSHPVFFLCRESIGLSPATFLLCEKWSFLDLLLYYISILLLRYCPFEKLALYQVTAYGKREGEGEECTCQSIDTERRGYRGRCYLLEEQRRSDIPEKADGKSIPQHATSPLISDNFRLESSLWTKCNIQHLERALYRKYIH